MEYSVIHRGCVSYGIFGEFGYWSNMDNILREYNYNIYFTAENLGAHSDLIFAIIWFEKKFTLY